MIRVLGNHKFLLKILLNMSCQNLPERINQTMSCQSLPERIQQNMLQQLCQMLLKATKQMMSRS